MFKKKISKINHPKQHEFMLPNSAIVRQIASRFNFTQFGDQWSQSLPPEFFKPQENAFINIRRLQQNFGGQFLAIRFLYTVISTTFLEKLCLLS
jgi:hypothetical protein